ncbi:hydroxyethylthiazole kinase [Frisingicoccus sp.]|uniref:hydroxyethylthiazole kinase n=1 Tax=Frisingicoccus sp. TaxID=1918627 RepID=UPI003999EC0B
MFRNQMLEEIYQIRSAVQEKAPLIHCITNPISIHDCANVVLAAGGRPMMAEHPAEVEEITATAGALALNLGNITDARKASILIAGKAAMRREIPVILDMVGIGCSHFRKKITEEFLGQRIPGAPFILKGNMSELKALAGDGCSVSGVDVDPKDVLSEENREETIRLAKTVANTWGAVVLASGKTDLVTDGREVHFIDNGCEMMGRITGTGCMLNVLTAAYMSVGKPMTAAVAACVVLGISGEMAAVQCRGTGSFQMAFQDALFCMKDEDIRERMRVS